VVGTVLIGAAFGMALDHYLPAWGSWARFAIWVGIYFVGVWLRNDAIEKGRAPPQNLR
jgi:uncharacterized membrane protein YbjE (DUF340 family)